MKQLTRKAIIKVIQVPIIEKVISRCEFSNTLSRALDSGTLSSKFGYFLCRVISKRVLLGILFPIFFDKETGHFDRLQNPQIYENVGKSFRLCIKNINNVGVGKIIKWRNSHTKTISSQIRSATHIKDKEKTCINILVATRSWHFITPLVEILKSSYGGKGYEFHTFDISKYDNEYLFPSKGKVNKSKIFREQAFNSINTSNKHVVHRDYTHLDKLDPESLNKIKESDIVLVDWLNQSALWAVHNLPAEKKIIVRVHSYEVFSYFSMIMNYGKIDGLIFISEAIKDIFLELWGWLLPDQIPIIVLENIRSCELFDRPKSTKLISINPKKKVLGMLQYAIPVKDFDFALDVFDAVRDVDDEFILLLGGTTLNQNKSLENELLIERLRSYPSENVLELGYLDDTNKLFDSVGYMLSTSVREGSHESVVEGMTFGCIPIIRDWPLLSAFNGAQLAFPREPVFSSAKEMAKYVLKCSVNFDRESIRVKESSSSYYNPEVSKSYLQFIQEVYSNA